MHIGATYSGHNTSSINVANEPRCVKSIIAATDCNKVLTSFLASLDMIRSSSELSVRSLPSSDVFSSKRMIVCNK